MSVISKIKYHINCDAVDENKTCFDCSECLKQFCDALDKVNHNCQGHLGKDEHIFELCEYCKDRMSVIRQLQVLRSGFKPLLKKEARHFFALDSSLSFHFTGPHLSGLYVDHLCEPTLASEVTLQPTLREYLHCRTCLQLFKLMVKNNTLLPNHNCINYSCNMCLFFLKNWSRLATVSQVCTRFILDEHVKEMNQKKLLIEKDILRVSSTDNPSDHTVEKLLFYDYLNSSTRLDTLIKERVKSKFPAPLTTTPINVAVEGSIGAGKTNFLNFLKSLDSNPGLMEFFVEPIDKWTNHRGVNLLEKFYESPEKNAFALQNVIIMSKLEQLKTSSQAPVKIFERSLGSSFDCFLPTLEEAKLIEPVESDVLKSWESCLYKWFAKQIIPDIVVYLKTNPNLCKERIISRGRPEEINIPLTYLQSLHEHYERWIETLSANPYRKVIIVDASLGFDDLTPIFRNVYAELLLVAHNKGILIFILFLTIKSLNFQINPSIYLIYLLVFILIPHILQKFL